MKNIISIPLTLEQFITKADDDYRERLLSIPLFNPNKTLIWDKNQKRVFASVFYHLRGHFIDFMWYIANISPDELTKSIILENIQEELGSNGKLSHEMLYACFAQECGVDINDEIINETNYTSFAKKFNKEHLAWLATHDPDERVAAFAAYERLDNIDYLYLLDCVKSMNISPQGEIFFKSHSIVEHFGAVVEKIIPIWEESSEKIIQAFNFIYSHQIQMWEYLSNRIFLLEE